ncbi:MAG: DUF5412 domain-containing protein [Firmicutes bacterium]|nr:DUF5412 domain-containing protein [Bacillota bacterium]
MKILKGLSKILGFILLFFILAILFLVAVINYFFFNIDRLPKGELLSEEVSPSGIYTVRTYISNAHSTVAPAVRGEVIYHNTFDTNRNIYWAYRIEEGKIEWISKHVVSINGRILDVRKDEYDFRKK